MLAFITVIVNREHDQDGDSVIKVYCCGVQRVISKPASISISNESIDPYLIE